MNYRYFVQEIDWESGLSVVSRVNAKIVLIMGNSEERLVQNVFSVDYEAFREYCIALGFKDVKKDDVINIKGTDLFLTHRPIEHSEDMLTLFGHTHRAGGLYRPYGINVGTDLNFFRLYSEDDIQYLLETKYKFWDNDVDNNCFE